MTNTQQNNNSLLVQELWQAYLSAAQREIATPIYDVFHFDDNEAGANELADLVLQGRKQATASLLWRYQSDDQRPPQRGDLSVVTDWEGMPLCVIETTEVEIRPFEGVTEAFAAAEGEGDLSLEYWREAHWRFFGRVCRELNKARSLEMPVVCEKFRVVFPLQQTELRKSSLDIHTSTL